MPVITFKVTHDEVRLIRDKARAAKAKSVSSFLRSAVLGTNTAPVKVVQKVHPVSGLPYNTKSGRVVTKEEIRAALADFP